MAALTVQQALISGIRRLQQCKIDDAEASARFLLAAILHLKPGDLLLHIDRVLTANEQAQYSAFLERRAAHEPVWYIVGIQEFYGLPIFADQHVLIPRPETEQLVELVIDYALQYNVTSLIDVGTGSGAIAIALAHHLPHVTVTATDTSLDALVIAQENARRNAVTIHFTPANLLQTESGEHLTADIIVANLPYIPSSRITELEPDVKDFEPLLALDGGPDGLDCYRRLFTQIITLPQQSKAIFCEIDETQGESIVALVQSFWPTAMVTVHHDLAGLPRFAAISR